MGKINKALQPSDLLLQEVIQKSDETLKKADPVYKQDIKENRLNPTEKIFHNTRDIDYIEKDINLTPEGDDAQTFSAKHQSLKDKITRGGANWFYDIYQGAKLAGLSSMDLEQSFKSLAGVENEFNTSFMGMSVKDIMKDSEDFHNKHRVYEQNPGEFSPGDAGWIMNQIASSGTGIGMGIYALAETFAVGSVTEGLGGFTEAANWIRKIPGLAKMVKNINSVDSALDTARLLNNMSQVNKLRNTAILYSVLNRGAESNMNASYTFAETYKNLLEEKDENGQPKFTEQQAKQLASKAGISDYKQNMALLPLDILGYTTMVFNPVSGTGTGLLEKGLEKVASVFGKSKLGKAAGWLTTKGIGVATEGLEEGFQYLSQKDSENFARSLGGLEKYKGLSNITEGVQSDEFWNNFAGGVIGSPVIGATMNLTQKALTLNANKKATERYNNYISNIGQNLNDQSKQIRELEKAGRFEEANSARYYFSLNNALQTVNLDALNDKETGFENLTNFYKTTLEEIEKGNTDTLKDLGFENPSEETLTHIKENYKTYLEDAIKIKDIFHKVATGNNKNLVPAMTMEIFNLGKMENIQSKLKTEVSNEKENLNAYKNLSSQGQTIADVNFDLMSIDSELKRLEKLKASIENEKELSDINNLISELEEKKVEISNKVSEINADNTYTNSDKRKDQEILKSTILTGDFLDKNLQLLQNENNIRLQRNKVAKWADKEFVKEQLKKSVKNSQTREQSEAAQNDPLLENDEQVIQDVSDKEQQILSENDAPNIENPYIKKDEEIITENLDNIESKIDFGKFAISHVPSEDEFMSNPNDDINNELRDLTKNYYDTLKEDLGREPTFEDFVREGIKDSNKQHVKDNFKVLERGWKLNGYPSVNYDKVYKDFFDNRRDKFLAITNTKLIEDLPNPTLTSEQRLEQVQEVLEDIQIKEGNITFDEDKKPINKSYIATAETLAKFAYISLENELIIRDEQDAIYADREYTSRELNIGEHVDSRPLLDYDKFLSGEELVIRKPKNFEDITVPIYDSNGNKLPAMKFGEWVKKYNIEPNSQAYKDKIPLIIYAKGIEKGVAFVHDVDWYNPYSFTETNIGDTQKAKEHTRKIRENVLKGNGGITIIYKRNTTFEGLKLEDKNSAITLKEANPETIIALKIDGKIIIKKSQDKFIEFGDVKNILINQELKLENDKNNTFEIRRYGTDSEGRATWVTLPVIYKQKINEDVQRTVIKALEIHASQNIADLDSQKKKSFEDLRQAIILKQNLDLFDYKDLQKFLKQFIIVKEYSDTDNPEQKHNEFNKQILVSEREDKFIPYIAFQKGGNFIFGISNQEIAPGIKTIFLNTRNSPKERKNQFITTLKQSINKFNYNVSIEALSSNKAVFKITENNEVEELNANYTDYLKNNLYTNIKSHNIGTVDKPKYITSIQPIITYELTSELNKTEEQKIKEIISDPTPIEKIDDKEISSNLPLDILEEIENAKKELSNTIKTTTYLSNPSVIQDKSVEKIAKNIIEIGDLLVGEKHDIVNFIYNQVQLNIDFTSKLKIDLNDLRRLIRVQYLTYLKPLKEHNIKRFERFKTLKELYPNEAEKSGINDLIQGYKEVLDKIKTVEKNYSQLELLALEKIKKYTNIKIESNTSIDDELYTRLTEDIENENLEDGEDYFEIDKREDGERYEKESVTEDHKNKSSYEIKRFLSAIPFYTTYKEGKELTTKVATGFLNLPKYMSFDDVYERLSAILADSSTDYNIVLALLKENEKTNPWIKDVIDRLEKSSNKLKKEFVSQMYKHSLKMEYTAYGYNKATKSYTLRKYYTNANDIKRIIKNTWENNYRLSDLFIKGQQLNVIKTQNVLNKLNTWRQKIEITKVPNGVTIPVVEYQKALDNKQSLNLKNTNSPFTNFISKELGNKTEINIILGKQILNIKRFNDSNMSFTISYKKPNKPTFDELNIWLKEIGINLSDNTIMHLFKEGYYTKDGKVSYESMFTDRTKGIFYMMGTYFENMLSANNEGTFNIDNAELNMFENSLMTVLANIESKYNSTVMSNSFRDNGKSLYGFTASKYITERVSELKKNPVLLKNLSETAFSNNSMWLEFFNSENSDFIKDFEVIHEGLTSFQELGKKPYRDNGITKLADSDHELAKLGLFMDMMQGTTNTKYRDVSLRIGRLFSPTMSDKSTQTILKTYVLDLKNKDLLDGKGISDNVKNILYQQLVKPELLRIIDFHRKGSSTNIDAYDSGAVKFNFLPELNNIVTKTGGEYLINAIKNNPNYEINYIEEHYTKDFYEIIDKYIDTLKKEKLDVWDKNGYLIKDDKGFIIETKYFDTKYFTKFTGNVDSRVEMFALDFIINNLIANANSFMLIAGDPAIYYKKPAKSVVESINNSFKEGKINNQEKNRLLNVAYNQGLFINVGKRLANQIAPGQKIADSDNNKYLQIFLQDKRGSVNDLTKEYFERLFGKDKIEDYLDIESTDAQEYTTWKEHLYILEQLGKMEDVITDITPLDIRKARELFSSGKSLKQLNEKEQLLIKKVLQPMKPVYTGQIFDKKNGVMRTMYIKSSSFPLIPQLTEGLELDKLRNIMENLEAEKDKTVRASYQTANKVGALASPLKIWGDDGRFVETPLLEGSNYMELERKHWRIQQDVPFKSDKKAKQDEVSMVTQAMKQLFGNGIMNLNGFQYNGETYNGKDLQKVFTDLHIQLVTQKKNQLYEELGYDPITNKPIDIVKSAKKLQGILLAEAKSRNFSLQDLEALQLEYTKDAFGNIKDINFKQPLWISANANKYEQLLQAIVNNRVNRIKFPGYSFVAGSEEGFKIKADLSGIDKNKIVWTSAWKGELQSPYKDKEGNLIKGQVLVPSKFKNKSGELIDLFSTNSNGDYIYVEKTEKGWYLKDDIINKDLLELTSFRIPSSGHQSMAQLEIAGFLPYESGDIIIVPKNLLKQKGLDFDVDKEYTYQLYHEIQDDGKIKIFNNPDKEDKILINEIIKVYRSVLSNPDDDVQRKIHQVLSIDYAKKQSEIIDNILNGKKDNRYFTALSDEYQKQKMFLGSSGKIGIGAFSLDVNLHSLIQQQKALDNTIRLRESVGFGNYINKTFKFGNIFSQGVLGETYTLDGSRTIAEVLSELQNIATDNEKEQVMGKVNLNEITLDAIKTMVLLGFDKGSDGNSIPFLLLSQPVIREYVELLKNANSNIAEYDPFKKENIVKQLLTKYGATKEEVEDNVIEEKELTETPKMLSNDSLMFSIKSDKPDNQTQRAVLRTFLDLLHYGEKIRAVQSAINMDSKGLGKSVFENQEKIVAVNSLADNKEISGAKYLIGDFIYIDDVSEEDDLTGYTQLGSYLIKPTTLSGAFTVNSLIAVETLFGKYFPYSSLAFANAFNNIISIMNKGEISESKSVQLKQDIFKSIKKFLNSGQLGLYNNKTMTAKEERQRLFFDSEKNTSLANYLKQLRNIKDNSVINSFIHNSKLINRLLLEVKNDGSPSLIKYNNSMVEDFDNEAINNTFIEMLSKDYELPIKFNGEKYTTRTLAQDLISYAMLEGGVQEAIQFSRFVPISYLYEIGYSKEINKLNFNNVNLFKNFILQYFQHNPNQAKIIDYKKYSKAFINTNKDYDIKDVSTLKEFEIEDSLPEIISIYNDKSDKKTNKFLLFKYIEGKYYRIPTLGVFGMSEYEPSKEFTSSLLDSETLPTIEFKNKEIVENTDSDKFNISTQDTKQILDSIDTSTDYGKFLNAVKEELLNLNVKTRFEDTTDKFASSKGVYIPKSNTVVIDTNFTKKSSDIEWLANLTHEYLHALTVNQVKKWLDDNGRPLSNAPAHIQKLVRLYDKAVQHLNSIDPQGIQRVKDKLKNKEVLGEDRIFYGGKDIYEFIADILTNDDFKKEMQSIKYPDGKSYFEHFLEVFKKILNDLGINLSELNLTNESILTIFAVIKEENKQVVSQDPLIEQMKKLNIDFNMRMDEQDLFNPNVVSPRHLPEIEIC